jgi:DNA-binding NarL/FixJ family response regulator
MNEQEHASDPTGIDIPRQRGMQSRCCTDASAVRVLLVDDTPVMLRLLRLTFEFQHDVEVVGEAGDGREALALWRAHRPDVVVMDLRMPVMTGLESAAQILAEDPTQRVVLFSAGLRAADQTLAAAIGVAHCIDKCELGLLMEAVVAVRVPTRQP